MINWQITCPNWCNQPHKFTFTQEVRFMFEFPSYKWKAVLCNYDYKYTQTYNDIHQVLLLITLLLIQSKDIKAKFHNRNRYHILRLHNTGGINFSFLGVLLTITSYESLLGDYFGLTEVKVILNNLCLFKLAVIMAVRVKEPCMCLSQQMI